jgi:hypothetical protein
MSRRNHTLFYRPLRGGISVWNPLAGGVGTLGFLAESADGQQWLVSCYHVLGRPAGGMFNDREPIYQPNRSPGFLVAETDTSRADAGLDCAAAPLLAGIIGVNEVLGVGALDLPTLPLPGMVVLKAGQETGVTEGVIRDVTGDVVTIDPPAAFPSGYDLSNYGDSGAVWVERDTRRPIALHTGGNDTGREVAYGVSIAAVLNALQLTMVT